MDRPSPPGTRLGGRTCKAHAMCLENLISTPRHFSPRVQEPTLFSRRAPRPFKPGSRCHSSSCLQLTAPVRLLSQPIRDVEAPRAHVSVWRYLGRSATAHAAIPGVRCSSAVAEHPEILWVFCVRIGGVVARTRLSLVSSDCEGLLLVKRTEWSFVGIVAERKSSRGFGGPTRQVYGGVLGGLWWVVCRTVPLPKVTLDG